MDLYHVYIQIHGYPTEVASWSSLSSIVNSLYIFVSMLYYFSGIRKYSELFSVSWISQVALKQPLCTGNNCVVSSLQLGAQCW